MVRNYDKTLTCARLIHFEWISSIFVEPSVSSKWSFRNEMLTSKISFMVVGDFINILSFPGKRIVLFTRKKKGAYAALISWNICLFAKACLHFSGENTETFSSLTSYLELRRSEFLIGGYVGARALLLSAAPQDLSY